MTDEPGDEPEVTYSNFSRLLHQAIRKLEIEKLVEFSELEVLTCGWICADQTETDSDPIADRVCYEIDHLGLPKYVALIGWLSPFGLASHYPELIRRLAKYLLGDTKQEEENKLPAELRQKFLGAGGQSGNRGR